MLPKTSNEVEVRTQRLLPSAVHAGGSDMPFDWSSHDSTRVGLPIAICPAPRPAAAMEVPHADAPAPDPVSGAAAAPRPPPGAAYVRPRHHPWAELLRRVFAIDILACPDCGGRLHLVATIEARAVIERILVHLGLPLEPPRPDPPRSPEWLPGLPAGAGDDRGDGWQD
jgi:hypothetical protein